MRKKKIVMYVYNDITTDARVQRAAEALSGDFDLILISSQKGKTIEDKGYKNIFVGGRISGFREIMTTIFATWRIIREQHPDIVYCHDYYSAILAYILLLTHFQGKICYDAHELIIPEKGRSDKRQEFFYWFEKRIVKRVDMLVCASEQRGEIMQKHYGLKSMPFVVPNISQLAINDNDPDTANTLSTLKEFFSRDGLTIVYAGVVTTSRRINELFDAVLALADRCKLLIVGDGDALSALKEKSAAHSELTVAFTGKVPYKSLGSILSRCDIGFLYYPIDTLNNIYCASNKIYEYASVGLPMLSNENPTVKHVLEDEHIGISTSDFKEGLQLLAEISNKYKDNCDTFTKNNQWNNIATQLVLKITTLK